MSVKQLKRGSVEALKRKSAVTSLNATASTLQPFDASTIAISNRQRTKKINVRLLKQIVSALFEELKIESGELGINLVSAKEMARVNWQFLQHEGSTDVITFNYSDSVGDDVRSLKNKKLETPHVVSYKVIHGELFICVEDAVAQSKEFGTTWQSEVVRYTVHGILHLLGHDDLKPAPRRKMKREENRLVRLLAQRFTLAQL
jgi:probable rRNA maturation factor